MEGKVRKPPQVDPLYRALRDAESGVAQGGELERWVYEPIHAPPNVAVRQLQKEESAELLQDGERLKLPPTPEELEAMEEAGIPDDFDIALEKKEAEERRIREAEEKREIMALPPPPKHKQVVGYWASRGTTPGGKRRVAPAPSPLHNEATEKGEEWAENEDGDEDAKEIETGDDADRKLAEDEDDGEMQVIELNDNTGVGRSATPPPLPARKPQPGSGQLDNLAEQMSRSSPRSTHFRRCTRNTP